MNTPIERAGWAPAEWGAAIGVSRAMVFNLLRDEADLIESVRIGSKRIITTPPGAYLRAKAAQQSGEAA